MSEAFDGATIRAVLARQSGVITRQQVHAAGGRRHDIERQLRRREWVRMTPGIYRDHTGAPRWATRAWAAVLGCHPAALDGQDALRAAGLEPVTATGSPNQPVAVVINHARRITPPAGVRLRRLVNYDGQVLAHTAPPRLRVEEAALDAATSALRDGHEFSAIEVLAAVCRARLTTPSRLAGALEARARCPGRRWLIGVLADIHDGACSVLEHGYLHRVERGHGLPRGARQHRDRSSLGAVYRDVLYRQFGLVIELDGRSFHAELGRHDQDLDRDLDAMVSTLSGVRIGWGQVFERPCLTAVRIGELLRLGGWRGEVRRCGPGCRLTTSSPATGSARSTLQTTSSPLTTPADNDAQRPAPESGTGRCG